MGNKIESKYSNILLGTWLLSKGMNKIHSEVLKICRKYKSELMELQTGETACKKFIKRTIPREKGGKGGQPITEYLLNYNQLILFMSFSRNLPSKVSCTTKIIKASKIETVLRLFDSFDFDGLDVRYVYAMQDSFGNIKIGISNNPERRLKEISANNSMPVKLLATKKCNLPRYQNETLCHHQAEDYLIKGEWFTEGAKSLELI